MNAFKGSLGILIAAVSMAAPFAATWASAHGMILLWTERWIYFLSYLAVIIGWVAFLAASFSKPAKRKLKILFSLVIPFAGWSAVDFADKHADEMFTYYKMNSISPQQWQQMASEIHQLAKKAAQQLPMDISRNQLPKVFDRLGRKEDLWVPILVNEWGDDVFVSVNYGGRQRRWGLVVAPQEYFDATANAKHTRISVATNACFYIHWGG